MSRAPLLPPTGTMRDIRDGFVCPAQRDATLVKRADVLVQHEHCDLLVVLLIQRAEDDDLIDAA